MHTHIICVCNPQNDYEGISQAMTEDTKIKLERTNKSNTRLVSKVQQRTRQTNINGMPTRQLVAWHSGRASVFFLGCQPDIQPTNVVSETGHTAYMCEKNGSIYKTEKDVSAKVTQTRHVQTKNGRRRPSVDVDVFVAACFDLDL